MQIFRSSEYISVSFGLNAACFFFRYWRACLSKFYTIRLVFRESDKLYALEIKTRQRIKVYFCIKTFHHFDVIITSLNLPEKVQLTFISTHQHFLKKINLFFNSTLNDDFIFSKYNNICRHKVPGTLNDLPV